MEVKERSDNISNIHFRQYILFQNNWIDFGFGLFAFENIFYIFSDKDIQSALVCRHLSIVLLLISRNILLKESRHFVTLIFQSVC